MDIVKDKDTSKNNDADIDKANNMIKDMAMVRVKNIVKEMAKHMVNFKV